MKLIKLMFTGVTLFIAGLLFYSLAVHSIDLSYNGIRMGYVLDVGMYDNVQSLEEMYISGIRALYLSLVCFTLSFFLLLYPLYALAIDRNLNIDNK